MSYILVNLHYIIKVYISSYTCTINLSSFPLKINGYSNKFVTIFTKNRAKFDLIKSIRPVMNMNHRNTKISQLRRYAFFEAD